MNCSKCKEKIPNGVKECIPCSWKIISDVAEGKVKEK